MKELGARYIQQDDEIVRHPVLPSAKDLRPITDREYKILYLFDVRRLQLMSAPSVREIGQYIGIESTGHMRDIIRKMIKSGHLREQKETRSQNARSVVINVNFTTVNRVNPFSEIDLPEIKGLTSPINED